MTEAMPIVFALRRVGPTEIELVISNGDHTCKVYPLSFDQMRLLSAQSAEYVAGWPVKEVKAM